MEVFWALFGVLLGFGLGEGTHYIRHRLRIRRLRKLIFAELKCVLAQIPQKKDIVSQIVESLCRQEIMPGTSVPVLSLGYRTNIGELYPHLTPEQRNCLHVIHERLAVSESVLDSYATDIVAAIQEKVIVDPFTTFQDRMGEILQSYKVVERLIESYLTGKPIDVFPINRA